MRLGSIVIWSFLIVSLLTIGIGSHYHYIQSTEILEEQVVNQLESVAESRANHIETYLEQNIERLKLITSRTKLRETLLAYNTDQSEDYITSMTRIIDDARESVQEIERICIIGTDGVVITSTSEEFYGVDLGDKEFFLSGLEKESINFVEEDEIMKIFVSGPFIFNNEVIGVGLTVVDAEVLEEIVRERTGLGDTGEVLVAIQGAEERIYLFDRLFESEAISQLIQSEETAEPMNNALAGNEKVFLDSLDYRDQRVIAVSQYISIAELGLVAKIDLNEAKGEQQDRIIKTTIIIVLVSGIYVFIVGLLISLYLSKSIRKLTKDVNDITKGKIDIQLEKSRILEISELTESLNRILASLKLAVLRTGLTKSEFGLGEVVKAKKFAEEKYKKIFEVVPSGIYTEDNDHIISSWNKKAEEITGFKAKEVINKKPNFYVKEKSVDFEKGVKMPILDQEAMIKTKKGKKIIVSINADNLTDVNERVIGKIITFQNITERKKKTEQLEKFVNLSVGRELRMKELKKELHKYKRRKK